MNVEGRRDDTEDNDVLVFDTDNTNKYDDNGASTSSPQETAKKEYNVDDVDDSEPLPRFRGCINLLTDINVAIPMKKPAAKTKISQLKEKYSKKNTTDNISDDSKDLQRAMGAINLLTSRSSEKRQLKKEQLKQEADMKKNDDDDATLPRVMGSINLLD